MTQTHRVRCTRIIDGYVILTDVNEPGGIMAYTVSDFARYDFAPSLGMEFDLTLDDVTDIEDDRFSAGDYYSAELVGIGNVNDHGVRTPMM